MQNLFRHLVLFKQKTAYEMRISDWSSDVCSSDLAQTSSGTNYWIENNPAPYTSGSVDNAPPTTDIIALSAGGLKTITFSQAVTDPYLALVSWNGNSGDFSQPFDVISQGCG